MKKIISFSFCLILLFATVFFTAMANNPSYNLEGLKAETGTEFSLPISIENNSGIISLRFRIHFDENVLELVKVENTALLAGFTSPAETLKSPYTLRWADSLALEDNTAEGEVAVVTFKVKESAPVGETEVYIEHIESRRTNGDEVNFFNISKDITIVNTHSFSEYFSDNNATCITDGTKTAVCDYGCGEKDTVIDTGSATGHSNVTLKAVAPTCTVTGLTEGKKCSVCNTVTLAQETVKANGHKEITLNAVAATCKSTGLTEGKKCSVCDTVTVEQETINLKSHSYKAATCTTAKTCKVCGVTSGKALGHKYTNACDTSCNTCKATRKITHSYKSDTTKATLTKNGKVETKCSVCGKVSKKTTVYYPKTIKLEYTSTTYNGKVKTPTVTVKDSNGNTLKKDTDYTVKYASGRKNIGKYTVTVTFKGKYTGTKKLTFTIIPAKVTLSKLTAGNKQLTADWKTVSGVTGYEVQYSTSSKFTSKTTKTVTVKSSKTKKTTIKKLTKGKKYFVKVRAYKTVDGKKIYGAWSTVKNVKVK